MRPTILLAPLGVLLSVATGCRDDTSTPNYPLPDGLWTASGSPAAILRLAPSQLNGDGDLTPATTITTPSADLATLVGIAFDAGGNMWVASPDDSHLLRFAPGTLAASGSTAAAVVIAPHAGSLSGPTGLAFDPGHRLWVANHENGTLVGFGPAQLAVGGTPAPAVVLSGLGHPTALAFDATGALWVSDNTVHTISKFTPGQLAASGSPAPAVVLRSAEFSLLNPGGLAFDATGNLWVANIGGHSVAGFSPAQLNAGGAPAPHIVLTTNAGSLSVPVGLAFDAEGSLWVVGGPGALSKFEKASLGASGAPAPSTRLKITDHSIFWSVAFWPRPTGLPLF